MLQQILNMNITISDVMLGIIIILGVIILYKFLSILVKISGSQRTKNEPVYKNLIKKTEEIKHLP